MPSTSRDFFPLVAVSLLVPIVIIAMIFAMLIWIVRRNAAALEDPAVAELKDRYARGEIETAEFQVRLRELTGG